MEPSHSPLSLEDAEADTLECLDPEVLSFAEASPAWLLAAPCAALSLTFAAEAEAAGGSLVPSSVKDVLGFDPGRAYQVTSFLLHHPVLTALVAGSVVFLVPRLVRVTLRWLVVPIIAAALGYSLFVHPQTTLQAGQWIFGFIGSHPVATSLAILIALGLSLSPYILSAGLVLLLVGVIQLYPQALAPLLPQPLVEANRQLGRLQEGLKQPLADARRLQGETSAAASKQFEEARARLQSELDKTSYPYSKFTSDFSGAVDSVKGSVSAAREGVVNLGSGVVSGVLGAGDALQARSGEVSGMVEKSTYCRKEATPELRTKCVEEQRARVEAGK